MRGRPFRPRCVNYNPEITYFKPRGVVLADLEKVNLELDEVEAIRLKDLKTFDQKQAAKEMKVSTTTFQRILNSARQKISDALINGKAIKIEDKLINQEKYMAKKIYKCVDCGHEWSIAYGTGRPTQCPKCQAKNFHRVNRGSGAGRGLGPCGRGKR